MKKTVEVIYVADSEGLSAQVLSNDFNLKAIVTQGSNLGALKQRARDAIDMVLEDQGHAERTGDLDITYRQVTLKEFSSAPV